MNGLIVGIDLGTTNSLVAYFDGEKAVTIPNRLGGKLTPSVVSVDAEGKLYVGQTALERRGTSPKDTAYVFKRSMGTNRDFVLAGKKYRAEELSSLVLASLKEDAESFLGQEVTEAVISVPAYFNDAQRKATKRAGELAGLKVERLISEPTAAAIAYGLHKKDPNTKFLVFDLGGGTFDISVIELSDDLMEVRAVAGDNFLGGENFTEVLEDVFCDRNDIEKGDLTERERAQLLSVAEKCKIALSDNQSAVMQMKLKGETVECDVKTSAFEFASANLLARLKKPIERSLKDANIKVRDIDEIVMVGGATRMPMIRNFVTKLFGRFPNISLDPDEVVAMGAAIQAAMKERREAVREMIMTDVCPFTLGTEVVVTRPGGYDEPGHFFPIIERNTVIPVSHTERLYTAGDYQSRIRVKVLQGESRLAANNLLLGELEIPVPKKRAGEEAVDVTYTYDINSILEVEVKVVSSGLSRRMVLKKDDTDLTDEEIDNRFKQLSGLKRDPRDEEENRLLLLRGERLYEECTGDLRRQLDIAISDFEAVLTRKDADEINGARKSFKSFLDSAEESKWDDM